MNLTPTQFKSALTQASDNSYLSNTVIKAVQEKGYGEFLYYSCPKLKAMEIIKELQADGILKKSKSAQTIVTKILSES